MQNIKALIFLFSVLLTPPSVLTAQFVGCDCQCASDKIFKNINDYDFVEAMKAVLGNNFCFDREIYAPYILGAFKNAPDSIKQTQLDILRAITFYENRYGLAYDAKSKRYGFIDRSLNIKLPFQYEEAEPFTNDGLGAIVKRNNTRFLIDTLGNEYKVATKLSQLDQTTKALVLRDTDLQALPPSISMYKQLEIIILYRRTNDSPLLKELPTEFGQLANLSILNVSGHPSIRLPKELGNLQKLEKLIVSGCQLTALPKELGSLKNLTYWDLSYNQLENLPVELGQLSHLQTLTLNYNKISSLPKTFGNLQNLIDLDLQMNALTYLPNELGKLRNLRKLNLNGNQLTTIPKELTKLKKIEYLYLGMNAINSIPKELGQLKTLRLLYLRVNKLVNIPKELGQLKALKELYLGTNKLSNIPEKLGNLNNLEILSLENNALGSVPKELGQLSKLTSLILGSNQLESLPRELGNLKSLEAIFLENNKISSLPIEIFGLQDLTSLSMGANKIENLPNEVCNLRNLTHLNAESNQITSIPHDIGNLKKLESLRISGNKIIELPSSLCDLPVIRDLFYITNNPLEITPDCVQALLNRLNGGYAPPPREAEIKMLPTDSAFQAAQSSFSSKKYSEAYKAALLSVESDSSNYNKFFNLSFYALFAGEYKRAIQAAQKTLSLNSEAVNVETNLALGYLLDNQYDKAEAIYKKWKGRKFTSSDTEITETIFLQDIKDLENAGVLPKERAADIKRIRKLLEN